MGGALDRAENATLTRDHPSGMEAGSSAANSSRNASPTDSPVVFIMVETFNTGGSERQFTELARALRAGPFQPHLGCIQREGAFQSGLGDVPEFPLGGSLYGMQSMRSRMRLAKHLRKIRALAAHSFDFYSNLTMIPAARLAGVPVVIGSLRQIGDLLTPAQFRAQMAAFRWCDQVVCNSQAAARELVERGFPEKKIAIIGNGLAPEAFADVAPAFPTRPGVLRVGLVARMNAAYKNHEGFLRAAARLHTRMPEVEFVLAGDGPLRLQIEQKARDLGIFEKTLFLGDQRDIAAVLASVDVSVQPSTSESLSNVILESMASGKPVIAALVGGNPELVSPETGLLVDVTDDEQLAAAMERLLRDRNLRLALGEAARRRALAEFTREHMQRAQEALYAELLAQKGYKAPAVTPEAKGVKRVSKRLRVALVAPTLRYVGGQAVQADLLMRQWHEDPEVDARFLAVDPQFPRGLGWVSKIPFLRTVLRAPIYMVSLWRNLRNADIAHIFSASYWSFVVAPLPAWLIAHMRGKKTIINYRSGEARDHLQRSSTARSVLKKTDRLVVPSGYLVEVFREFGLHADVVPNIVDLSQFGYRLRDPLRPHLVCTRGFHTYYCVDSVIRAFAEVQKTYPDARLDLVGGGPLEQEMRALVQQMQLRGVHFTGVVSRNQIGQCYADADIFINASRLDNMPVSVIEAFASGTPVVTTAPESMRFLVEHERTGLLCAVGDVTGLAANVIRLLRDRDLATRLSAEAYRESERYRWTAVREQWVGVYRSLIGSDRREVVRPA